MNIKVNAVLTTIISILVTIITSLIITGFSSSILLISGTLILIATGEIAMLYFMKRKVIYRKQNIFVIISIAMLAVTVIVAMINISSATSVLPQWCSLVGVILLFSGNFIMITALVAQPRHGLEEYREEDVKDERDFNKHGPYDAVRHPNNLGAFLIALALPLILRSGWAFIPAVITIIFIIIHAISIDNYRFEKYTWYYDYTKKVPYMMIPVIW